MGKTPGIKTRRIARECFMQLLYEMEAQNDFSYKKKEQFFDNIKQLRDYEEESKDFKYDSSYVDSMFNIIANHLVDIDRVLIDSSTNWKLERIDRVDLAIIRLSTAEILYYDEIPDSVSINEAVELAKRFGTEESGKFVNGILGRISRGKNERN
ncbi:MAG: transcription antitermination factor NusB [Clostridiales bacterium]|jgi:N utilization substance protein B|nr:transcription antitermination factor NusB [Clostridiales bacterium]